MYGGALLRGRRPRGSSGIVVLQAMEHRLLFVLIFGFFIYDGTDSSHTPHVNKTSGSNWDDLQDGSGMEGELLYASSAHTKDEYSSDQYDQPASTEVSFSLDQKLTTSSEATVFEYAEKTDADANYSGVMEQVLETSTENSKTTFAPRHFEDDSYNLVTQIVTDVAKGTATPSKSGIVWGEVGRGFVSASSGDERGDLYIPGRLPALLVPGAGARGRTRSGPYFEEDSPLANVTAPAGSTVLLDCRVAMLHDKVVTWATRRADRLELLTVGKQPYSAERRIALSFRYPNNWRLKIENSRKSDQGLYECQVAAHPPIIRQIYLSVISPEVSIFDESGRSVVERYYKSGSFLQLTCSAVQLLEPPSMLAWWQGNNLLTEGTNCNVTGPDSATCMLVVEHVTRAHAGTYTCGTGAGMQTAAALDPTATGAPPPSVTDSAVYSANATVAVHVLHGNLIGVAVLPNTGKSIGAKGGSYISVQKLVLGLTVVLFIQNR